MRARCSRRFAAAALVAALVGFFPAGCESPEDDTLLRFLGFQGAGSSGADSSVSMIEGDLRDGTALKVDASFENQTVALDASGGGTSGITIYRVEVDYGMSGFDPPSFSYPVSLFAPAGSGKDGAGGGTVTLSDIPIVPVSVKQWLIDNTPSEQDGVVEMTANVDFLARTDAGEDLTVGGALAVTLKDEDGGGATDSLVTIQATEQNAVDASPGTDGRFTVYRTGDRSGSLVVSYSVGAEPDRAVPGATCAAGIDYRSLAGTVSIPAGSPSSTITVDVCPDSVPESPETVTVTLSAGAGYTVSQPDSDTVTIRDSD